MLIDANGQPLLDDKGKPETMLPTTWLDKHVSVSLWPLLFVNALNVALAMLPCAKVAERQFFDRMISDLCEEIGEIGLRIDAIHLAGLGDGVDAGGALAAGVGAAEEIVLSAQNRRLHRALSGIVRHLQAPIGQIAFECRPSREAIADGLCERTLATDPAERGVEKRLQLIEQGGRVADAPSSGAAAIGRGCGSQLRTGRQSAAWPRALSPRPRHGCVANSMTCTQNRTTVGGRARRAPLGIWCTARDVLSLFAGPQGGTCRSVARYLPRLSSRRWLHWLRQTL